MQIFFFSEKKTFIFLCSDILPLCPSQFQSSSDVTTTTLKKKLAMGISLQLFQDQIYHFMLCHPNYFYFLKLAELSL
jgi:hypothetical protein